LKIAVSYTGIFPPLKGASGGDRRVRDIVRGFCQGDNEVVMYVPIWQDKGQKNLDSADYSIQYIGSKSLIKIPFLNRISFWWAMVALIKRHKTDAILFYGAFFESYLPARILRGSKTKVLMEVCDLQSSTTKLSLKSIYEKLGEKWMPRATDFNLVISKFLFDFIQTAAPKTPIDTIPILVDRGIFHANGLKREGYRQKKNITDAQVVITYVGGMWKEEGVDVLIESFAKLVSIHGDKIKLLIAGKLTKDPTCTDVEGLIEQLNIKGSVILAGWVDTETVTSILNASDILTVPQGNATFNKAGLPTKLAEYSAMGKAIVATKMGDVPLYFKHEENAVLCTPSDTESLFNALNDKIGKNALITAKTIFDYQINGLKIINIIKNIVK
jgi:glycosyltransferase involved in cell wall biosynthesis